MVLTTILPDPVNIGYQDLRFIVLDKLNGQKITSLADIERALTLSTDGFHRLNFSRGDTVQRAVLDKEEAAASTSRILQRYGIPKDRVITSHLAKSAPGAVPPATVDDLRGVRGPRRK